MRRAITPLLLLSFVLSLLVRPQSTLAAPAPQNTPQGECHIYTSVNSAAGEITFSMRANQAFISSCVGTFSDYLPGDLLRWSATVYQTPDFGAVPIYMEFDTASIKISATVNSSISGTGDGRTLPNPFSLLIRKANGAPDGPINAQVQIVARYVSATPTPTRTATVTNTPVPSAVCDGVVLHGYGDSCIVTISGYDAVWASCSTDGYGSDTYYSLRLDIKIDGTTVFNDWCRQANPYVFRADKKTVTITYYAADPNIPRDILIRSEIDAYNDIYITRGSPNSSGMYYEATGLVLKPWQYLNVELPSPAAAVRSYCQKTAGNGGLPMLISVDGGSYAYTDNCNFGPQFDRFNASNLRYLFPNQLSARGDNQTVNIQIYATAAFVTATNTPTATTIPPTATASPYIARTPTSTRTPTRTPTATLTLTPSPTGVLPPCAVSSTINVPVAPGTVVVSLTVGIRFVVADAPVTINFGSQAITVQPGSYQWDQASEAYTIYSLTIPARILVCAASAATATPAAATNLPTLDPADQPCIPATPIPADQPGTIPDLALILPTWTPVLTVTITVTSTATVTATPGISLTAVVALVGTISTGVISPAQAIQTATAPYTWASGQTTSAGWASWIAPVLPWLAIINPTNPAWDVEGGPLWALKPFLFPILPILGFAVLIVLVRFALFIAKLLLALLDLVIKAIELIPGE